MSAGFRSLLAFWIGGGQQSAAAPPVTTPVGSADWQNEQDARGRKRAKPPKTGYTPASEGEDERRRRMAQRYQDERRRILGLPPLSKPPPVETAPPAQPAQPGDLAALKQAFNRTALDAQEQGAVARAEEARAERQRAEQQRAEVEAARLAAVEAAEEDDIEVLLLLAA